MRTVTSNDDELVVVGNVVNGDLWKGSDDLLLRWEVGALLEFEIANGAREGEVAVDSAKVDKSTGCANSCLFACGVSVDEMQDLNPTHPRFEVCGRKTVASRGP